MATLQENLSTVNSVLTLAEKYTRAARVLGFDQQTICPDKGKEEEGEISSFLENEAFKLTKDPAFIAAAEALYLNREKLEAKDRVLAERLHRDYARSKNISPETNERFSLVYNKAYVDWYQAKGASDFEIFKPSLAKVVDITKEALSLREDPQPTLYDNLLDDYERGMTTRDLDDIFESCKQRLIPLLRRIMASKKQIRTDFMHIPVTDEQQKQMAEVILNLIGYDFSRGALTTTEHPFTDGMSINDVRVTTHYDRDMFYSSIFTVIHEGGHALFEQFQPVEDFAHHIEGGKTMGMHESVSRFYENILGRSRAFIHALYPEVVRIFPEVMEGVSEEELYEAMNTVQPSLIRTDADEFTYTFHIIIRYEIEKALLSGEISVSDVPRVWADKYEAYLGVRPATDAEGALQDIHWTFGFGYFPTYAIGNFYNSMYYNEMKKSLDVDALLTEGNFSPILSWMQEHVFLKANSLSPKEWIQDICGRSLTPDDFLDYLEQKYTALYELD